ncbi:MAG: LysR family transcriptional regulator [Firmicutes bacterium]|nr:LysR family transcriptional regulator [Bacillota bacterium]
MRYMNYMNFSVYHIKLFLSLCETLSFTKAAEQCNVTQPTLSRIISQLENTLGIQLFVRNTVRVTMTPAGRSLYRELKRIYGDIEDAILQAYRLQKGRTRQLTIGICDGLNVTGEMLEFMEKYHEDHPNFEINMIRDVDESLLNKLRDGTCDLILDLTLKDKDDPFIESRVLFKGPLMLYMLESNPLLEKEYLTIEDLPAQRLLVRSPSGRSGHAEMVHHLYEQLKLEPRFSQYVSNALELSLNIKDSNEGILADGYYVDRFCPYLFSRPIQGTESIVWVRWTKEGDASTDTRLFAEELVKYYHGEEGLASL